MAAGVTAGVDSTAAGLREVFGGVLDFEEDLGFSEAFAFGRVWAGVLAVALVAGAARFRAGALAGADVDRAALVARVFAAPALAAFFAPAFAGAPFAPDFLAPDPAAFGLGGADRDWLRRRQGLHPFGAYLEPLHFDGARISGLPRAFIDCSSPAFPTIEPMHRRVRETPGFAVVEMATGHCPQVQSPAAFVRLLGELIHAGTSRNEAR